MWRLTVTYMCGCGDIGKEMADQVLTRVPLQLERKGNQPDDEASRLRAGDLVGVLKELSKACHEYGREGARREICKVCSHES
jgi:nuclear pore complex protein Nup85